MSMSGLVLILTSWMAVAAAPPHEASLTREPFGQWIPADTAVVVEVTDAGQWSGDFGDNQLGQILLRFSPANRFFRGWRRMQQMLDQTSAQMVDNYFGKSVVLLAAHTSPGSPMVIASRLANRQKAAELIEKFELQEREVYADHHIYQTPDGGAILSVHDTTPTIILTSERNTPYLKRLIDAAETEPLLKDDQAFVQFLASSPQNSVLKGYIRVDHEDAKHSFFVTHSDDAIRGHYVGKMPQMMQVLSQLGSDKPHRFGPLPPDCMAAVSVNLSNSHPNTVTFIDKILAPKSFLNDVQPKLGQSMVLFLNKPQQAQMIPSVGLAIQMKDTNLASDMDTFMKNVMVVSSMSLEKRRPPGSPESPESPDNQPPPPPVQPLLVKHNQTAYRTAPVANIKMIQQGMTVITPIQLSWGRINNWYVVSSDKETFCQCVDNPAEKASLIQQVADKNPQANPGQPIAQLQIKPQIFAQHLQRFGKDQVIEKSSPGPGSRRFYRQSPININDLCKALNQFASMKVDVYRDAQNQMVTEVEMIKQAAE